VTHHALVALFRVTGWRYPLNWRLGGPQNRSGCLEKRKTFCAGRQTKRPANETSGLLPRHWYVLSQQSNVKQPHYRPGQTLRVPGWGSQISRQSAHEGGKVVSHTHRPPLPPRKYSWYSFLLRGWVDPRAIVRPKGLCQWKIPMTPPGIEPATFQLVAQCLSQLRHRVPHCHSSTLVLWARSFVQHGELYLINCLLSSYSFYSLPPRFFPLPHFFLSCPSAISFVTLILRIWTLGDSTLFQAWD
jgi:hypothetical protein